ncbi:MAG: UDP-3-O-(3-hydroxymyristoyl)glucosamine N-acyltransferase [Chitinophagaceae bacterium]|nr:UDP-3-O-(3-hydroxymyristoyl)glucosamine N-acyltransferase [Chitinophagaceae bacterium]MCZ2398100.1 UDP-3-O-(3-hydroxymyristoyl)glucosamine N-acyltransferase [Chitinophagales bacterium]
MEFTAQQIAAIIGGKVEGNPEAKVSAFGRIETAIKGEIAFLANPKYEDYLYSTGASIVIINKDLQLEKKIEPTLIRVSDPYSSFAALLSEYEKIKQQNLSGIQQPVFIHATAKIGENVFIGAFSYIGENVVIGDNVKIYPQVYLGNNVIVDANTILFPGVKIYHNCIIGKSVCIHGGTIIGSDGFGFAPQLDGTFKKIPQIGNVVVEDFVEIGSNCSIDRSTIGSTIIRAGAKLDNLIQIAHNAEIGSNTVIAAQSGVSGSTKIGKNVMIGGQAGLVGHLHIADGVKINAQSGVTKSIKTENTAVTGTPAFEYTQALRSQILSKNLPDLEKRIKELEKALADLQKEKS